jgi:aromatic-amino-acid transaminase
MDNALIAGYAGLAGDPDFLKAVERACFMDKRPSGFVRAVATPGGTGAVRHAVGNFTNPGDVFITANWFWSPYQTIADENGRKLDTFNLFDESGNFDYPSYEAAFEKYLLRQKRLLVVLNTPAHNPTGYTLSSEDWDKVIALARRHAADGENRIALLVDMAYIDFAGEGSRDFMAKLGGLEENVICLFAYSASKSYTMYGLRNGALLCLSSSEGIADEFYYSCAFSNRGIWSNGTRGAMAVIAKIYSISELYEEVVAERIVYRKLLRDRGGAFMESARREGLATTNYKGGFFASVPCGDPQRLCEELINSQNLYTVPLQKGIRVAICAVSEEKCALMPKLIARAMKA